MTLLRMDDYEASLVRRFLFGRLPAEEAERFETRLLEDAELFETVQAVEDELLDDYVRGRLSADDRTALASRFEHQPERLRFAEALARRASVQQPAHGRILTWAAAAAILLIVGGALLWRQPFAPPDVRVPVTASQETKTSPAPAVARQMERVTALNIVLATTRGGQRPAGLELPADATAVALAIRIHPADIYPSYEITLSRADGTSAWSGRDSAPVSNELKATIPASALASGEYQLAVAGLDNRGNREDLGEQTLTVRVHAKSP